MGEVKSMHVSDCVSGNSFIRSTWHGDKRLMTVSIWQDNVCTSVTRIDTAGMAALASHFTAALGDAASRPVTEDSFASFDWTPERSRWSWRGLVAEMRYRVASRFGRADSEWVRSMTSDATPPTSAGAAESDHRAG